MIREISKDPIKWIEHLRQLETVKFSSPSTLLMQTRDFKIFLTWARLHGAKTKSTLLALAESEKAYRYLFDYRFYKRYIISITQNRKAIRRKRKQDHTIGNYVKRRKLPEGGYEDFQKGS